MPSDQGRAGALAAEQAGRDQGERVIHLILGRGEIDLEHARRQRVAQDVRAEGTRCHRDHGRECAGAQEYRSCRHGEIAREQTRYFMQTEASLPIPCGEPPAVTRVPRGLECVPEVRLKQ